MKQDEEIKIRGMILDHLSKLLDGAQSSRIPGHGVEVVKEETFVDPKHPQMGSLPDLDKLKKPDEVIGNEFKEGGDDEPDEEGNYGPVNEAEDNKPEWLKQLRTAGKKAPVK